LDQLIIQSGGLAKGASALKNDDLKKIIDFGLSEIVKLEGGSNTLNLDKIIENSFAT